MKKMIKILIIVLIILFAMILLINLLVKNSTKKQIVTEEEAIKLEDIDCILVLGAGVRGNQPTHMLEDRLLAAISLYENNVSSKIIMSGDHGRKDYDEVNIMKD